MIQPPQQQGPSAPSIVLTVTDPRIQIAEIGSTVRLRCSGQSLVGRQVLLRWGKEGAPLPPGRAQDDRRGVLIISDVRHSDSGTYVCSGQDCVTVVTETVVLNVGGKNYCVPSALHDGWIYFLNTCGYPAWLLSCCLLYLFGVLLLMAKGLQQRNSR